MSDRFADLRKVPDQPAARLLAANNATLRHPVASPANAPVAAVLAELAGAGAWVDLIRLLSVSLPPRECVWWACLAGRQVLGEGGSSPCLSAAEAWVFDPSPENRARVRAALETQASGDRTAPAATAALYAPGNLGDGEMSGIPAPVGVVATCAFGVNLRTLKVAADIDAQFQLIIDRALDIARGGNGKVAPAGDGGRAAPKGEGGRAAPAGNGTGVARASDGTGVAPAGDGGADA